MIRLMKEEDLGAVVQLEQTVFSVPWSECNLRESLLRPGFLFLVSEDEGKITGYAGLLMIAGEGDVTNIAVFPEYRGRGIGAALTKALLVEGRKRGMNAFTLEVRVGNQAAIHIYEKLGFRSEGVRKGFYEKPKEDALIMWRRDV